MQESSPQLEVPGMLRVGVGGGGESPGSSGESSKLRSIYSFRWLQLHVN